MAKCVERASRVQIAHIVVGPNGHHLNGETSIFSTKNTTKISLNRYDRNKAIWCPAAVR